MEYHLRLVPMTESRPATTILTKMVQWGEVHRHTQNEENLLLDIMSSDLLSFTYREPFQSL